MSGTPKIGKLIKVKEEISIALDHFRMVMNNLNNTKSFTCGFGQLHKARDSRI